MAVAYIAGALVICVINIGQFGAVFGSIFKGAFTFDAAVGGAEDDYLAVRCDDLHDIYIVEKEIFAETYEEVH